MASAAGRTCSSSALRPSAAARSTICTSSACCTATGKPGALGQSMLATLATQAPRNSRGAAGGISCAVNSRCWGAPQPASKSAALAMQSRRVMKLTVA